MTLKRKTLITGCVAFILGMTAWLISPSWRGHRSAQIPVTLLGYTNDVTGLVTTSYTTTNIASSGFAVFRIHNPTRRTFFGYIGPIFFQDGQIDLHRSPSGDFDLSPGTSVTFAVPAPDTGKAWQCGVILCHAQNYPRWQYALVRFAERCGLDLSDKPWFTASSEIVRGGPL